MIQDNPLNPTYESKVVGVILILMNVFCIAADIFIVIFCDCGLRDKLLEKLSKRKNKKKTKKKTKKKIKKNNNSKVAPQKKKPSKKEKMNVAAKKAWDIEQK